MAPMLETRPMNKMALNMVTELKVLPNQLSLWALLDAQIYLPPFQIKFPIIRRNEKEKIFRLFEKLGAIKGNFDCKNNWHCIILFYDLIIWQYIQYVHINFCTLLIEKWKSWSFPMKLKSSFLSLLTDIFFATEEVKYSKYVPRAKRWDKGCVKGHILVENWCDHRAKHQQQVQLDFHLTASCSICVCEMLHSSIHPRRIRNDTTSPQTKKRFL